MYVHASKNHNHRLKVHITNIPFLIGSNGKNIVKYDCCYFTKGQEGVVQPTPVDDLG